MDGLASESDLHQVRLTSSISRRTKEEMRPTGKERVSGDARAERTDNMKFDRMWGYKRIFDG